MPDERDRKNGVTKPKAGTKTRMVWDILTEISEKQNRPATREEALEACLAKEINKSTITTQYSHWKRYHGIQGKVLKPGEVAKAPKKKTPKKAAKETATPPADAPPTPPEENTAENLVPNDGKTDDYDAGWDAYCEGKQESDNPHEPDSSEGSDWTQGFRDAANQK